MQFIQITDTHFMAPGERIYGGDPAERLAAMIDVVNRDHADADFVLITGDLADLGDPAAYALLRETVETLKPPLHLLLGNHDSRASFAETFPEQPLNTDGHRQFRVNGSEADILCLDTLIDEPGEHGGHLCKARLDWLAAELADRTDPWLLAMHHPPGPIGLARMDAIGLKAEASDTLAEIIAPHPPLMILCGHVHRPIHGVWRSIPFHIQRAVNHQVAYRPVWEPTFMFSDEPADFSVFTVEAGAVTVHQRSMGAFEEFDARGPCRAG